MIETIILSTVILIFTLASAFFSGTEIALFSLSPMRVKAYKHDPNPRKRLISELLHQPRDLLVTVFMMNTLVNILLQNAASKMFGTQAGWGLKVGVPLVLTLVFGEIIPKVICMQNSVALSYYVVPIIDFIHRKLATLRKITIAITLPISRILFFYCKKEESISEEELEHVLETSEKHGVLHPEEAHLVWGYLKLHSSTVKEIMVPHEDIIFYEISEPITKLIHLFVEQECTRLPVCEGSLDKVLGIITAKQFFLNGHSVTNGAELKKWLFKPFYVPETTHIHLLLRQLEEKKEVMALVVDEYGNVTGLVTREDIAEQVIGNIVDRRDQKPLYTVAGEDEIIASGKLELSEFNEIFDVDLESPTNMVTIGGWLIEKIGEIPKGSSSFEIDNFLFQVLAADRKRVIRLYIRKLKKPQKK
jgi:CBS domain containing-hemolysin-like protein